MRGLRNGPTRASSARCWRRRVPRGRGFGRVVHQQLRVAGPQHVQVNPRSLVMTWSLVIGFDATGRPPPARPLCCESSRPQVDQLVIAGAGDGLARWSPDAFELGRRNLGRAVGLLPGVQASLGKDAVRVLVDGHRGSVAAVADAEDLTQSRCGSQASEWGLEDRHGEVPSLRSRARSRTRCRDRRSRSVSIACR